MKQEPIVDTWMPMEISAVERAFPATVSKLMPKYEEIPDEFRQFRPRDKWQRMVSDWFFSGLEDLKLSPKTGIDERKAIRHIATIMGSFEPKHEHKEAACAYLLSLWFDDVTYTVCKKP
jgi:hypothetical protein